MSAGDSGDRDTDTSGGDGSSGRGTRGVYAISVAAELTGLHPQSLRFYEDHGLLHPERTEGGTRRYSDADLAAAGRIAELIEAGLNIAGIKRVLDLEHTTAALRAEADQLRQTQIRPLTSEDCTRE